MSSWRGTFETGYDPEPYLKQPIDQATLDHFYGLQKRGFARAGSAIRAHLTRFESLTVGHDNKSLLELRQQAGERLVSAQIGWLEARDAAMASYLPKPTKDEPFNPWPLLIGIIGASLVVGVLSFFARRRSLR